MESWVLEIEILTRDQKLKENQSDGEKNEEKKEIKMTKKKKKKTVLTTLQQYTNVSIECFG